MARRFCRVAFVLFIFGSLVFSLEAQSSGFPSLEPDPKALGYAGRIRAGLSWQDLAEISLWASGAEPPAAAGQGKPSYTAIVTAGVEELLAAPDLPAGVKERGDYILSFMHKKFLTRYSVNQTRMDTLLVNGSYNCVSSAVLYTILASAAGLKTRGVVTRDHAFVTVEAGEETIDAETTNPYGFDPGNRREFHDAFGRATGFAYVPARNYRDRTDVDAGELVSLILHNRISDLESRGRFAESVPLAVNRAVLLSSSGRTAYSEFFGDPRGMLQDRIFNYAAMLLRAGKEPELLEWAELAGAKFPAPERWQGVIFGALNNGLAKLIRNNRFEEGRGLLAANASKLDSENYRRLRAMLADAELSHIVSGLKTIQDADDALAALDSAEDGALLADGKLKELRILAVIMKAGFIAGDGGVREAIAYAESAREEYGNDSRLNARIRALRDSRVVELHNGFAALYNRQDFEKAGELIQAALEEFPENARLLTDRELLEKARAR
jgi:tetratricopeptide (TPR) repeat protein